MKAIHQHRVCDHCGTRHSPFKPCAVTYAKESWFDLLGGPLLALALVLGVPLLVFLVNYLTQ